MAHNEITLLPDRLDREPIIYWGMTDSELIGSLFLSLAVLIPLCAFIGLLFGYAAVGAATGLLLSAGFVRLAGFYITPLKRMKPDGYHKLLFRAWLEDHLPIKKTMIRKSCVWSLHRTKTHAN